jgi:hypothetical protein
MFSGPSAGEGAPSDNSGRDWKARMGDRSYLTLPTRTWRSAFGPRGPNLPDEPTWPRRRRSLRYAGHRAPWFLAGLATGLGAGWIAAQMPLWPGT